jgi:hypothetical protein
MKKLLMTAALCSLPAAATAAEVIKYKAVYHVNEFISQAASDAAGH